MHRIGRITAALLLTVGSINIACTDRAPAPATNAPSSEAESANAERSCDEAGLRNVVDRFGERLKEVSLLAPDSVVVHQIREQYASVVTPDLLNAWIRSPRTAPGRDVSSPWPERIEILSISATETGTCRVDADVLYVTSAEVTTGSAADRIPATLHMDLEEGGWRISAYETAEQSDTAQVDVTSDAAGAADVIRRYFEAIAARDYERAYAFWESDGAASGQTFEQFAAGYAETARVEAEVGRPGRVEPAAGSRYAEVPVAIHALTSDGEEQRFEGSYTVRRSVVGGASAEERRWHIYAADIASVH